MDSHRSGSGSGRQHSAIKSFVKVDDEDDEAQPFSASPFESATNNTAQPKASGQTNFDAAAEHSGDDEECNAEDDSEDYVPHQVGSHPQNIIRKPAFGHLNKWTDWLRRKQSWQTRACTQF